MKFFIFSEFKPFINSHKYINLIISKNIVLITKEDFHLSHGHTRVVLSHFISI